VLGCGLAEATPITVGFAFQATDFFGISGNGTAPPVDIVSDTVSFTFDEDVSPNQTSPPDAVNLTIADFRYDASSTLVYVDHPISSLVASWAAR